ncbi:MAG TPA: MFS transporter, partial [Microbacterium sp.]|nr:MFS transporter [Microbacterium sp.]
VGLATAQLTGVILVDVPVERSGQGSGTQSTARQIGSALGIAILGTVLFTSTAGILASNLEDQGMASDQADQIVTAVVQSAGGAIAQLEQSPATSAAADAAKTAFSDGTRYAAFTAAGFLAIGLVATLALPSRRPEEATESDHSENAPKTATD